MPNLIGLTSDNVPIMGNGYGLGVYVTTGSGKKTTGTLLSNHLTGTSHMQNYPVYDTSGNLLSVGSTGTATSSSVNAGVVGLTTNPSKSGIVSSLSSASQKSLAIIKY